MRKISSEEVEFIKKALKNSVRMDGRLPNELRNFKLNCEEDILKTANGACHLTLGNDLSILVGIKAGKKE